jgi:hypothetical protein
MGDPTVHHPRALLGLLAVALAAPVIALSGSGPATAAVAPTAVPGAVQTGGDVSWPNCPKGMGIPSRRSPGNPMPVSTASFVVVGLTNGPGWYPNPCLAAHVAWARTQGVWTSAYSMTTFPTAAQRAAYGGSGPWSAATRTGRLRNAGYQQALFNVASMRGTGLRVPFVWVDVEPYPTHPWPHDVLGNREVVRGVLRAYHDNGYGVGFYSYDNGWRSVVGAWRKPAYPAWVPVGPVSNGRARAAARCGRPSFSGGPVYLAQWVQDARDRDVTCPALVGRAALADPLTGLLGSAYQKGDSGSPIRTLQRGMNMRPQYVSGVFDDRTVRVLLAFQRIRTFPPTGVATDLELRALGAGTVTPAVPTRLPTVFSAHP